MEKALLALGDVSLRVFVVVTVEGSTVQCFRSFLSPHMLFLMVMYLLSPHIRQVEQYRRLRLSEFPRKKKNAVTHNKWKQLPLSRVVNSAGIAAYSKLHDNSKNERCFLPYLSLIRTSLTRYSWF